MRSDVCTVILLSLCTVVEVVIAWLLILRERRAADTQKRLDRIEKALEKKGILVSTLPLTRKIGG